MGGVFSVHCTELFTGTITSQRKEKEKKEKKGTEYACILYI
jgi:hypothetical protein